jgi:hypothetical protein
MSRYLEVSLQLHERHFSLLRLARLRGLYVAEHMGGNLYAVPSYSRKSDGLQWVVTPDSCSCPAVGYCTHRAIVVHHYFTNEAEVREYLAYRNAERDDFAALELRVLHGETTAEDRAYVKPLIERVRAMQPPRVEVGPCPVPAF